VTVISNPPKLRPLVLLALLFALACTAPAPEGHLTGTVTWQGQPIAMALVEAYPKPERDPATPPVGETPSAEDGSFRLALPPGEYWLWARASVPGEARDLRLVGQAAGNPLRVRSDDSLATTVALEDATGFATATGPAGTGVRGAVSGAPPRQVTVYAYPGRVERPVGPGFGAAVQASADGSFHLDLAPGDYTLAARWRASGTDHGSVQPEDRVAVAVATVTPGHYLQTAPLELRPVDPAVWAERGGAAPPTETWITGRVVDAAGNPRAGVRILVFDDPRMAGKPLALSPPTGDRGAFRVYLPGRGRFFLGARSHIGGPASPGEWTGAYRGEDGDGLRLSDGAHRDDLEIRVQEVW